MRWIAVACVVLAGAIVAQEPAAPPVAGVVRGRVVDENGKPIAGVVYGWTGWERFVDTAALLAKPPAATGEDGVYSLPFQSSVRPRLVFAAAGRQACVRWIDDAPQGQLDLGDLVLPPGERLTGRVRDEAGVPLAGVQLIVESSVSERAIDSRQALLLAGAVSNDEGIFQVPCVPRTGLRLLARAEGYLQESRLVAQESPIDLTMVKVGVVRGRVVDADGKPVKGASVRSLRQVQAEDRWVTVGEDGAFVLSVPCRGRFRIVAHERLPPYREFHSALLHGAAEDVLIQLGRSDLEVQVVDAVTKQPLPKFALALLTTDAGNVQMALLHAFRDRREYEGSARVSFRPDGPRGLYVEAPGHGYEVVRVPEDCKSPLVVALGPEAVLRGRVFDAATGKPMAGVAVRALPRGDARSGGGSLENAGPLSGANGDYVVRGLRPGNYGVQAHAEGRLASFVAAVTLVADREAKLDLSVPGAIEVEVLLTGAVPTGPRPTLWLGDGFQTADTAPGSFQHTVADPAPVPLARTGRYRLGPLLPGRRALRAFVPSRTRVGVGTFVTLGDVDSFNAKTTIALPDLTSRRIAGRIELPADVPTERVAVLATRRHERDGPRRSVRKTGIDAGGRFAIDLPPGGYALQLADLATGIVFHTEAEDAIAGTQDVLLKPSVQWLTVGCEPTTAGAEAVVDWFRVSLPRPRDGTSAFLGEWGDGSGPPTGSVPGSALALSRWLVPHETLSIQALQGFDRLRPGSGAWRMQTVANAVVDIDAAGATVKLKVPDPPTDEELRKPR